MVKHSPQITTSEEKSHHHYLIYDLWRIQQGKFNKHSKVKFNSQCLAVHHKSQAHCLSLSTILQQNSVCWFLFGVRSTSVLLQGHIKDPSHFAENAGGRLHLYTHTPLAQQSWSGLTMPPSRHSVGTYQETSSHTTHQGTLSCSPLSLLSHCGLILVQRVELVCTS